MKRLFLVAGILLLAVTASGRSMAADVYGAPKDGLPTAWVEGPTCNPWVDYNCAAAEGVAHGAQVDGAERKLRSLPRL